MDRRIEPSRAHGAVAAPPSKSFAHRLLLCAALAQGDSVIHNVAQSEDMLATLDCIAALGARYRLDNGSVAVTGRAGAQAADACFPCRESGSTLRFFIPAALLAGQRARFTGTARLMERGVGIYEALFAERGIRLQREAEALTVQGALPPGRYTLRGNVSSQFVSGLLMALPLLDGDSVIEVLPPVESRAYIDITLACMRRFGVTAEEVSPNVFRIPGRQAYRPTDATVEGDWSNAAALCAFNALGGSVCITGLNPDSLQGDRVCLPLLERLAAPGAEIDLSGCPDLGPVLFAAAAANQGAVFTGTARLRIKESDRAQVMADELEKFGVHVRVLENTVIVPAGPLHAPSAVLDGHGDHRIVMALSLAASRTGGVIRGCQAVRKSFPDYFDILQRLGVQTDPIH